ncbi:MAG: glycosyltransferase family 4 protein [Caldilineaceae bacterium]|nr:glycosyltransferase family 4 protein [Caldilineaceae bacterium]
MRVVMVSKALVVSAYQRKAEALARLGQAQGIELFVLIPPSWQDRRGHQVAQPRHTEGYQLQIIPLRLNGNYHLHHYPTLGQALATIRPQVVHFDEEPYNLATWLGLRAARRVGAAGTFFTWQNLNRRYPWPFRWFERQCYRYSPIAIAGNQAAAQVLQQKGYGGTTVVIPQFGVDPAMFVPKATPLTTNTTPLQIGYAGGLLPEKGVDLLLQACTGLVGDWQLQLAGQGAAEAELRQLAATRQISEKITWVGLLDSDAMPSFYQRLDVLVLPSRTLPNWKEQFGRVLTEAMACGVAVIGSDSGEIPNVIGEAGWVFPEGDEAALHRALQSLLTQRAQRVQLGEAGRQRVLERYTMAAIAQQTLAVYAQLGARQP